MIREKLYYNINGKKIPLIQGGKGGCFLAGTEIFVPTGYGYIKIEDIRVTDLVFSFNVVGTISYNKVTQVFKHENQKVIKVTFWNDTFICVTPNHWFLNEQNEFCEIGHFNIDDVVISKTGNLLPIINIEELDGLYTTYNFTVENDHTYIANSIKVHNKGGGKATPNPTEDANNLFSTDILFLLVAVGEGPIYRINSNGPQDIEINEGNIDDLINLDTDGLENTIVFKTVSTTGTITQDPLDVFGEETVVPQSLSSPVQLRKGGKTTGNWIRDESGEGGSLETLPGLPPAKVTLQSTSVNDWDSIRFNFVIQALIIMDDSGNIQGNSVTIKITVFDSLGSTEIGNIIKTIEGKTNTPYKIQLEFVIPTGSKSSDGYKFTVEKTSNDSAKAKEQAIIIFIGWDEIANERHSYPRTSLIGYAIKSFAEHTGAVPTYTSLIKGLLCKVPSNYNQPILEDGEIDWRELEIEESGSNSYVTRGYRLQKTGSSVLNTINPVIYEGLWDGTFIFSWTQNPIWIIYDLLTNQTYGLGIPEGNIDKYRFYKIAQYCDAVDSKTGQWFGVDGYADGTFRHKPKDLFTSIRETLLGLNVGIIVKERRFISDLNISAQTQVIDIINKISASFRGFAFDAGGKISLNVDLPEEVPIAIFNEGNIEAESFSLSGIKEEEIITGVEVTYIEPNNHYRRELVRIDDPDALKEQNQIENIIQIESIGCTRRGQAIRLAQYLLASSKYIRRRVSFRTTSEGINLTVGEIISVSQRSVGIAWGYGGRVASNSSIASSNVILEHFTSPSISSTVLSSNTNPLALRVVGQKSDRVDMYLVSNNYSALSTGNTISGIDIIELNISERFKPQTRVFATDSDNIQFKANNVPIKGDLWTLGEVDPSNFYTNLGDKLFKITALERDDEEYLSVIANEYVSNVYVDSDTLINYIPVAYIDTISPLIAPPPPILNIITKPIRHSDGSITYDIDVLATTDTSAYPIEIKTEYQYSASGESFLLETIQ